MNKILDIREHIYNHFHASKKCAEFFFDDKNKDIYAKYYTAMYQLQDSSETLYSHRKTGFSSDPHKAYLEFWGIMQAIIIQQDCIRALHEIFIGKDIQWSDISKWAEIRTFRDLMAGHPLSVKKGKYSFMGRRFGDYPSITYEQYDVATGNTNHPRINLGDLLDEYSEEASEYLQIVLEKMQSDW